MFSILFLKLIRNVFICRATLRPHAVWASAHGKPGIITQNYLVTKSKHFTLFTIIGKQDFEQTTLKFKF